VEVAKPAPKVKVTLAEKIAARNAEAERKKEAAAAKAAVCHDDYQSA